MSNYLAKVVPLPEMVDAPPLTNLKIAPIEGQSVLVSAQTEPGTLGIYFPVGSQIHPGFLHHFNLYASSERNASPDKKGFFDDKGVVRGLKLKGHRSMGFWIPVKASDLAAIFGIDPRQAESILIPYAYIDVIDTNTGAQVLCSKYDFTPDVTPGNKSLTRREKYLQRRVRRQIGDFRFHSDTPNIARAIDFFKAIAASEKEPSRLIYSRKYHGTSMIASFCEAPVPRPDLVEWAAGLPVIGPVVEALFPVRKDFTYIWASRNVIRGVRTMDSKEPLNADCIYTRGFSYLQPFLLPGMTVYAEIIGPDGHFPKYTYGCKNGIQVIPYRITMVGSNGSIVEWTTSQIIEWVQVLGHPRVRPLEVYSSTILPTQSHCEANGDPKGLSRLIDADVEDAKKAAEHAYCGEDEDGLTNYDCPGTLPEGFVVRLETSDRNWFVAKIKNPEFVLWEMRNA